MTTKSATSVQRLHHDRNHNPCERSQTGEPCEGNPHARFDERGEETETMVRLRGTPTRKSGNNQASQDLNVHRASPRLYYVLTVAPVPWTQTRTMEGWILERAARLAATTLRGTDGVSLGILYYFGKWFVTIYIWWSGARPSSSL